MGRKDTRYSPRLNFNTMHVLKAIMSSMHLQAIKRCAFDHFMGVPKIAHGISKVVTLLSNYQVAQKTLVLNQDVKLIFYHSEFSIVMGLLHRG